MDVFFLKILSVAFVCLTQEAKKKYDKETEKYCAVLEKHLSLSAKKKESHLHEVGCCSWSCSPSHRRSHQHPSFSVYRLTSLSQADSQVDNVRQHFYEVSLEYVFKVQEVQERKMFDFVEPVSTFIKQSCSFDPFIPSHFIFKLCFHSFSVSHPAPAPVSGPCSFWPFSRASSPTITTAMSWQRTSTTSRQSWPSAFRM